MPEAVHGASSKMASNGTPSTRRPAGRVADERARGETEAAQRVVDPGQPGGVAVDREQVAVGEFEQVRALAARRGAGVEHARAAGESGADEQRRGELRGGILHRHVALGEARDVRHRPGLGERDRLRADDARRDAGRGQPRSHAGGVGAAGIDAQRQRRAGVVGGQHLLPLRRPVGTQPLDPPGRMVPSSFGRAAGGGDLCLTLAQEAPQHRVDERRGRPHGGVAVAAGGPHHLVDDRVVGIRTCIRRPQQCQRDQQQRIGSRGRRAGGERDAHRAGAAEPAQRMEGERLRAGTHAGIHLRQHGGEGSALLHRAQRIGGMAEQHGQRQAVGAAGGCGEIVVRRCHRWQSTGAAAHGAGVRSAAGGRAGPDGRRPATRQPRPPAVRRLHPGIRMSASTTPPPTVAAPHDGSDTVCRTDGEGSASERIRAG